MFNLDNHEKYSERSTTVVEALGRYSSICTESLENMLFVSTPRSLKSEEAVQLPEPEVVLTPANSPTTDLDIAKIRLTVSEEAQNGLYSQN